MTTPQARDALIEQVKHAVIECVTHWPKQLDSAELLRQLDTLAVRVLVLVEAFKDQQFAAVRADAQTPGDGNLSKSL